MLPIIIGFIMLCLNMLLLTYRYGYAMYNVQEVVFTTSPIYILIASVLPVIWWLYSTKEDTFNFYDRKKLTLKLVIANATMCVGQTIWTFVFDTLVFKICKIPTGRNLDAKMLFILCRLALIGVTGLFAYAIFAIVRRVKENEEIVENIENIRWQQLFDTRKNKDVAFDLNILRDMKTGKPILIKENDRFVHTFTLGNSGTGKTSSTFIPAIICDLNTKLRNMSKRVPLEMKFVKEGKGKAYKNGNGVSTEYDVVAKKEYADELEQIRKKYPDCGITVMAPNNAMNKDIIKLAAARNMKVNVLDPAVNYKNKNVRMVGLNPFYVEPGLDKEQRQIYIKNKAQTFAEVLLAVNDIQGKGGDPYFRGINESVTTNAAVMCMLYAVLNGKQTNITQIQSVISDFGKLKPIIEDIEDKLHMKVIVHELETKSNQRKDNKRDMDRDDIQEPVFDEDATDDIIFYPLTDESEIPEEYREQGVTLDEYSELLKREAEGYAENIHFVKQELLGAGAEKMFEQARGLRNILSNLLLDVRVKRALSAPEENLLDFDKAFARGEITLINTAIEFGAQSSTALGLFILLLMKLAVVRRPAENRMNHFVYIDEAAQYMHPVYEDMFALYRQYRLSANIAIQSLSQFKKNATTQYLRDVIMGSGVHIVFGRVSPEEMKIYEQMAGIEHKESIQTSINSNSELDVNYNVTKSKRRTVEDKSAVAGDKIRMRGFQEVTVYAIDEGRVLKGKHAKTTFPKPSDFKDQNVPDYSFDKYSVDGPSKGRVIEMPKANKTAKEDMKKYKTSQQVHNYRNEDDAIETLPLNNLEDIQSLASDDVVKQRLGNASMLLANVDIRRSYSSDSDIEEEPIEILNPSLLAANKEKVSDNKVVRIDKMPNSSKKKQPKSKIDENTDFSDFFNEDNDNDSADTTEEDALDELLAELNGERRSI
ncbi:TraM recognition domain-containing protein [Butyrivibrio proteoclasticus]|uniref:TraM recognition domain-containing protein n=1 Tax=Butyrivibrio proteoclasticus TaxID=43305 RepID=UPI00047DAB9E|nr:TraM recognition domain-containing protein [Butyrivibrio proteoclasticus]